MSLLLALVAPCWPCAPAPPDGAWVELVDEQILLAYDAASGTEDLILRPGFSGDADTFGYLIPTPSRPEVTEADAGLFDRLERFLVPEVVTETRGIDLIPSFLLLTMSAGGDEAAYPAGARGVDVLSEQRVGSYDVALLQASDADALQTWLLDHGFTAPDPVKAWTEPYLGGDWVFTALRIAADAGSASPERRVRESAIHPLRLSFETDRPFAPFSGPDWSTHDRQPTTAPDKRFFLVGPTRYEATEGDHRRFTTAELDYADRVPLGWLWDELGRVGADPAYLSIATLAGVPGEVHAHDLWLETVPDGDPIHPEPVVRTVKRTVFLPLVEGAPFLLLFLIWGVRRARGQGSQQQRKPIS